MKISETWLREWVDPPISTDELIKTFTMAGLEVDGREPAASDFTGVVVAKVLTVEPHPNADKLSVCSVNDGTTTFQVVCGASNVRPELKVPFAKIGAILSPEFMLKKMRLRGVESNGMLCSAQELGMAETAEGLLELPVDAREGTDIREYLALGDTIIEVDLTPNRGDCLSIAGLARELGVLTGMPVNVPVIPAVPSVNSETLPVQIEAPEACPKYLGRVIRNINPEVETPLWIQEKLRRSGLRTIDPIVDVTNLVLIELGQPMHAFDFNKLKGGIKVRRAFSRETLLLLDGKEMSLNTETLVIADHEKALAIAGVMGGKHSAVSPKTTDIFLESAYFTPIAVAGRARSYGIHTDSSHRYERGVDHQLQHRAIERATALLLSIVGGEPGPVIEAIGTLPDTVRVKLRKFRIESLLGMSLPDDEVLAIMSRLGIQLESIDDESWLFRIPSWRFDLSIEEDLIEELARVHGYDKLPVTVPLMNMHLKPVSEAHTPLREIRHTYATLGYQEVVTYSFVDAELDAVLSGLDWEQGYQPLSLANPISQEMAVMRSNLWPGLIKTLKHNQNRQQTRTRLFESGLVFSKYNNKISQALKVSCLIWGEAFAEQWGHVSRESDFFDLKGDLEVVLGLSHNLDEYRFVTENHPALQPGLCARIYRGDRPAGWLGALHPQIAQVIDIKKKVFLAELDFAVVSAARISVAEEVSRFPAVRRDLALVIDEKIQSSEVLDLLKKLGGSELQEVGIFDLYQGHNIENGKKSLALGLTFQHSSRTLVDADINAIIDNCIKALQAEFNAELR